MSEPRPPHQPMKIACRECGAPLWLRDERTVLCVCDHCGVSLELTDTEQRVLERHARRQDDYRLHLGERLTLEGAPYEVIGRVTVVEEDPDDVTHQYYLYHPHRAPRWLAEYQGAWSITHRTRVRPQGDPFAPGDLFTADGRRWRARETIVTRVTHVDGALPYVQRVGDRAQTRELEGDSGGLYEVTRTEHEIEYGEGREVAESEVAAWVGRPLRPGAAPRSDNETYQHDVKEAPPMAILAILASAALLGGGLLVWSMLDGSSGTEVARFASEPNDMQANVMSEPFVLPDEDDVVRIRLTAPVDNAWMYAQVALVEGDADTVVHVADSSIQYYHGYSGGESWTEGSRDADLFVQVEEEGTYRLLLGGASGYGEAASEVPQHRLHARVFRGASYRSAAAAVAFLCLPLLFCTFVLLFGIGQARKTTPAFRRRAWMVAAAHVLAVVGIVGLGGLLGASSYGVAELEHPDGVSIRQSSVPGRPYLPFLAIYDSPRSHLGGGVHAGK